MQNALGLHISQRIVDAHGGSIKLRDKGTDGIELCLLLPCEDSTGSFDI
jgi:nitrogen fixation/metabolism regulation signal transduction histidine kinase